VGLQAREFQRRRERLQPRGSNNPFQCPSLVSPTVIRVHPCKSVSKDFAFASSSETSETFDTSETSELLSSKHQALTGGGVGLQAREFQRRRERLQPRGSNNPFQCPSLVSPTVIRVHPCKSASKDFAFASSSETSDTSETSELLSSNHQTLTSSV